MPVFGSCIEDHSRIDGFCNVCGQFIVNGRPDLRIIRIAGIIFEFDMPPALMSTAHAPELDFIQIDYATTTVAVDGGCLRVNGINYGNVSDQDRVVISQSTVVVSGEVRRALPD